MLLFTVTSPIQPHFVTFNEVPFLLANHRFLQNRGESPDVARTLLCPILKQRTTSFYNMVYEVARKKTIRRQGIPKAISIKGAGGHWEHSGSRGMSRRGTVGKNTIDVALKDAHILPHSTVRTLKQSH